MAGIITIDELALSLYGSADAIPQWKALVHATEKEKPLAPKISRHTDIAQAQYEQQAMVNDYRVTTPGYDRHSNALGHNDHTNTGHNNAHYDTYGYSRHSDTNGYNDHSNSAGRDRHTNSPHGDSHTNSGGTTRYTQSYGRYYGNSYEQHPHTNYSRYYSNSYSKYSQNIVRPGAITMPTHTNNSYTLHTNRAASTQYHNGLAYDRYSDSYSRSAYSRSYTNRAHGDSYSNVPHSDSHSNSTGYDRHNNYSGYYDHTNVAGYNRHANEAGHDNHLNVAERGYYTNIPKKDTYIPKYSKGIDHENYVPSAPEIYEIESPVFDTLTIDIVSHDQNNDSKGTQDSLSKTVKYDIYVRQIKDADGNSVTDSWHLIAKGSTEENFRFRMNHMEDGTYELRYKAYNDPLYVNPVVDGVTKEKELVATFESEEKTLTFTLCNNIPGADLTLFNAEEFESYIFGNKTYKDNADAIKKYVDEALYTKSYSGSAQQTVPSGESKGYREGLFVQINLTDSDTDTYHKVTAGIQSGGEVITSGIEVQFPKDANGYVYPGSKKGYVFIPLTSMQKGTKRSFDDVFIVLEISEYSDKTCTADSQIGRTVAVEGVTAFDPHVVYLGIDRDDPVVNVSAPKAGKHIDQPITISASDVGAGLYKVYYQIVPSGTSEAELTDYDWVSMPWSKTISLKEEMGAGSWDIWVKAIDKTGNETLVHRENYEVAYFDLNLDPKPSVVIPGDTIPVIATIVTDLEIEDVEFYIDGLTEHKDGEIISVIDIGDGLKQYKYETELTIPNNPALIGQEYEKWVEVKVAGEDDPVKKSKRIKIVREYGEILSSKVVHTDEWERHRVDYNAANDPDRPENVFWAGEAFVIESVVQFDDLDSVNEGCLLETVRILDSFKNPEHKPDGTEYILDFTDYINAGQFDPVEVDGKARVTQRGVLWDESMIKKWGRPRTELIFEFKYTDGSIKYVQVFVDSSDSASEFFKLHRTR